MAARAIVTDQGRNTWMIGMMSVPHAAMTDSALIVRLIGKDPI
ncbi:hypothetical protein ABE883_08060 [Enterococcus raffinosus]|nr:hypothetical protein [Enterococcus raffinosus]